MLAKMFYKQKTLISNINTKLADFNLLQIRCYNFYFKIVQTIFLFRIKNKAYTIFYI